MNARVLVIDNYDSFTFNIVQELAELGASPTVVRNDQWSVDQVAEFAADAVVISPGPGSPIDPRDVGISNELIVHLGSRTPVLGICLGHQCIGHVFGAKIVRAPELVHGKTSDILHNGLGIFEGLPESFVATRYHSLVVERSSMPAELEITAETRDSLIMGLRHRTLPIEGVQFHPESVMTSQGMNILRNFLRRL